jgi:Fic family protein
VGSGITDATFVPPPPEEVPAALGDLERFLHAADELPLLVRVGMAHAQFETIHPFLDGNGRVGRLLITFLLRERAALHKPVLYLSHYFKQHRQEYYDRLQALRGRHRMAITEHLGRAAANGHKVHEALFNRPIVTRRDVGETLRAHAGFHANC